MLECYLNSVPQEFRSDLAKAWKDYTGVVPAEDLRLLQEADVLESLVKVWTSSRFIVDACRREPTLLGELVRSGDLDSSTISKKYLPRLQAESLDCEADLHRALRLFRRREMVRIAWRDIAGWSQLSETLMDVSLLAETAVQVALDFAYTQACERRGPPLGKDGQALKMVVLGMGKLGAWELNYSSDIDLIFAIPEEGYFDDRKGTSYSEFFIRVGRKLIQALDNITEDGFVFRVDMRLRPWGDGGALVMTFDAMEKYYREHGRAWERYAMIKARAIAGDMQRAEELQARLRPFVYRSYLDYGVFAELRELKQQIVDQQRRRDKLDNVKLGPGGIRDIEFITQVFQLIRGGRDSALQDRRLEHILDRLARDDSLPVVTVKNLLGAYRFLRVVEHRLQQYDDKQTNDLPTEELDLQRLAFSMGFTDWNAMERQLASTRETVKQIFNQVFSAPQLQELPHQVEDIWVGGMSQLSALEELGYSDSERAWELIDSFRNSSVLGRLGKKGSKAINQLMPLTIGAAADTPDPEQTLERVTQFFSRVAQRSVYLSLLLEHPLALTELLQLAARSPWIVDYLSEDPLLLDELLNPNKLYEPLIKSELASELQQLLGAINISDVEASILELRHFQQVYVLRVVAADITGAIPLITVSEYLCDIAEVILEAAVRLAWTTVVAKKGLSPTGVEELSGLGVIALGGLGSRDLSYDSDLEIELVWRSVRAVAGSMQETSGGVAGFCKAVAERLHLLLTSRVISGSIYRLYTRGDSERDHALVISEMSAYQNRDMTVLDSARYVQARYLFGDVNLREDFNDYRHRLLSSGYSMAEIVRQHPLARDDRPPSYGMGLFHLDSGRGGLDDIRLIVTHGVLCSAAQYPELVGDVETMSLLYALMSCGFITRQECRVLQRAYIKYREKSHMLDLQHVDRLIPSDQARDLWPGVDDVYSRVFSR